MSTGIDSGASEVYGEPVVAAPNASGPSDDREKAVVFDAVTKRYAETTALRGLSMVVERGEILGLLGPNGSGKSTSVNLLCGLIAPTSGTIKVLGLDAIRDNAQLRPLLGVVPQETALYGELSAERNLRFHADLYGVPRRERAARVTEMLELVDLSDRRSSRVKTFSGGMKRRLAIARAMLHRPKILYLDEPTLGVDVASRHAVWSYVRELRRQGTTVLLTTNYLEEASELCDRIVIIDHGQAVASDTPAALRRKVGGAVLEMTLARAPSTSLLERLHQASGVVAVDVQGLELSVTYTEGDDTAAEVLNAVAIECTLKQFVQRHASLDEVFLRLTSGNSDD